MASQVIDPTEIGIGARPLGMGKAYTAIANDGSALFTNPSGLSKMSAISMSGNLLGEVPYTVLGGSYNVLNGTVGVGYVGLGVTGIKETNLVNGTPEVTGNEGSFTNSAINLSYATELNNILKINTGIFKDTRVGATLKMVSQGFSSLASAEGKGGSGIDLDLGAIANLDENTKAGLTVKNLIPGNNLNSDEIPMAMTAGLSKTFPQYNLLAAVDAELSRALLFHLGAEWNPVQILKVRLGLDQKPDAGSTTTNLAAGLGIAFKGFTFDYAYHTYAGLNELTSHFISIGYIGEEKKEAPKPVPVPSTLVPSPSIPSSPAPILVPSPKPLVPAIKAPVKKPVKKPAAKKKR